jgi:chromosome segregation ATPase
MSEKEQTCELFKNENSSLSLQLTMKLNELRKCQEENTKVHDELNRCQEENTRLNDCLNQSETSIREFQLKLQDKNDEVINYLLLFKVFPHT